MMKNIRNLKIFLWIDIKKEFMMSTETSGTKKAIEKILSGKKHSTNNQSGQMFVDQALACSYENLVSVCQCKRIQKKITLVSD